MLKRMMLIALCLLAMLLAIPAAQAEGGTLELRFTGDTGISAAYSISAGGVVYAQGEMATHENVQVDSLAAGNYVVTIDLPADVMLTGINGYESLQRGQAQWLAAVESDMVSVYEVTLSRDDSAVTAEEKTLSENAGSVLVKVFVDINNNGVYAENETMLEGVNVSLLVMDGETEIVIDEAVTDENGEALLWAEAGEYILRCEMPPDHAYNKKGSKTTITHSQMEQSIDRVQDANITIVKGEQLDFGVGAALMAVVSGTVWLDENGDGLWQDEEPGVEGMLITGDGAKNGLHYETYTDENGYFEIRQIRTGTYNMVYHVPDGYVFTYKATSGSSTARSLMTTEADRQGKDQVIYDRGEQLHNQNIGLVKEAVIEGVCFLDANHNGYLDEGEEVLPGVEMNLYRQSNSVLLRSVTSDENGVFRFDQIRGDTFKIKATLPKGLTFTMVIKGDENANQFGADDGKREYMLMNVEGYNAETTRVMVGAISYGSISGIVYLDDNFSGAWDSGEALAQGISVTLLDDGGKALMTAKTNKNGEYTFSDLAPGTYSLSIVAQSGYAFTTTGDGSVVKNAGIELGVSAPFELVMGENMTGLDAGMIKPAKISGVVFADENDNGKQDEAEKGFAGTTVGLMNADGVVDVITMGAERNFTFDPVLPGEYYLLYELPEGGIFASVVAGGNQLTGDGMGEWFTVGMGENYTVADCGGLYLGEISGVAFGDSDGSGVLDGNETHLAGVKLILTPSRDDLDACEVITGADGSFAFADLHPDTYTLTVVCPEGYVLSQLPGVTLPLSNGLNEQTVDLQVGMGDTWLQQALGCVKPSSYTGMAWLDENLNGLHDADELPAAGETILMIEQRTGLVAAELVTEEDGSFKAEGLAPGSYTLSFTLEEGVYGAMLGDSTFDEEEERLVMTDIAIAEGTDTSGALLGLVRETTLQGRVWLDDNGVIKPVEGAEVTLLQDGLEVETIVTGEDGMYTFAGLLPDEYVITVSLPGKNLALEPGDYRLADGSLVSVLAENDGAKGSTGVINVVMGQHQLTMDIGSVKAGRLGDLCWLDVNGNGWQDKGDGGIPGVKIELMRNGQVVAETVSDQYGYYAFEGLYPGEYTLRATAPQQVKPTVLRDDIPQIVSVLTASGESITVQVKSGGVNYAADLGYVLVNENEYPAGYGEGATQNWSKP